MDVCTERENAVSRQGSSWWTRGDHVEEYKGKEEARGAIWIVTRKQGQKKRTTAPNVTKTSKRKFV